MKIDYDKTLEQLENSYWPAYNYETNLIRRCHEYRKIKLNEMTIENIRLLLGQNIGLEYLIPLAIDKLKQDILVSGDLFEGDLLLNILNTDKSYWVKNKANWDHIIKLFNFNRQKIEKYHIIKSIKQDWFDAFERFCKYY
jgi:hypothetical protein